MTDSTSLADLSARLDAQAAEISGLRTAARRGGWLRFGGGALVATAALVSMGQAAPAETDVKARSFVLLGADGKPTGGMGQGSKGAASIWLEDGAGKRRIHMTVAKSGTPGINLSDSEGRVKLAMGVANDGLTFIAFKDDEGKMRYFNFMDAKGNAKIRFKDGEGKKKDLPD